MDKTPSTRDTRRFIAAAVAILAVFAVFRWHSITFSEEIMVDESMFLADAMRANQFGYTPWYRYDSVTSGPLNTLPLSVLLLLGIPANFVMLHAFAAFVQAASFIVLMLLCVRLAGFWPGVALGVGSALVFALQQSPDFTHYSSNLVPFFILVSGWLVALRGDSRGGLRLSIAGSVAAGFIFALAPLAKTQASLPAFACWVGLALWLFVQLWSDKSISRAFAAVGGMALASAVPFLITGLALWKAGAIPYFLNSIEALRAYAGAPDPLRVAKDIVFLAINSESRLVVAAVVAAAIGSFLVARTSARMDAEHRLGPSLAALATMLFWLLAAAVAIAMPVNYTISYEIFLYAPVTLACAAWVGCLQQTRRSVSDVALGVAVASSFLAVVAAMLGPTLKRSLLPGAPSPAALSMDAEQRTVVALKELGLAEGETLFIWGWAPSVYVHTQTIPATRFSWAQPCTTRFHGYPVFREAMMADLKESNPRFIVDTMQSGYGMNTVGAHIGYYSPDRDLTAQSFYPVLAAAGYEWAGDVPLENGTKGIIFQKKSGEAVR